MCKSPPKKPHLRNKYQIGKIFKNLPKICLNSGKLQKHMSLPKQRKVRLALYTKSQGFYTTVGHKLVTDASSVPSHCICATP